MAERSIAQAAGIGDALVFLTESGPLDVGAVVGELTLSEAVRRAVLSDPGLQAALARVRMAMADADQARLLPNPVLNVVVRWGPGSPQIEASLAQDLIRVLRAHRRSSAADHRLRQAAADAVAVAIDAIAEVQTSYAAIQASQAMIPLLEERLDIVAALSSIADNRLQAGEGNGGDLALLRAQRVELEIEIADALSRQSEERLRLARMIGEPSGAAGWTLERWVSPTLDQRTEAQWIDAAMRSRPEVQSVVWNLAALGDERALAGFAQWEDAQAGVEATRDGDWFVGPSVSLPIPIFDMGQARRARVTAERIEAHHLLTAARREAVEEVRAACLTLRARQDNLRRVREELIPLRRQHRQQSESAFAAGLTDATPLYFAEQELLAAEARAIEIEHEISLASIRLQRAVGGPGRTTQTDPAGPSTGSAGFPHGTSGAAEHERHRHLSTDSRAQALWSEQ